MPNEKAMPKPQAKTIRQVVEYLSTELGLSVYGQCVDLKTGQEFPSHMDYDADDILAYRELVRREALWDANHE